MSENWIEEGQKWVAEHEKELFSGFNERLAIHFLHRLTSVLRHRIVLLTRKEAL